MTFTITIPDEVTQLLKQIATKNKVSLTQVIQEFIKLGLLADKLQSTEDAELLIHDAKGYRELILFFNKETQTCDTEKA